MYDPSGLAIFLAFSLKPFWFTLVQIDLLSKFL